MNNNLIDFKLISVENHDSSFNFKEEIDDDFEVVSKTIGNYQYLRLVVEYQGKIRHLTWYNIQDEDVSILKVTHFVHILIDLLSHFNKGVSFIQFKDYLMGRYLQEDICFEDLEFDLEVDSCI